MNPYIIKFSSIWNFLFWMFYKTEYKTKEVLCDMKNDSSNRFSFKSDVYEGYGYKIKGKLKYAARYFLPIFLMFATFPALKSKPDVLALLIGLFLSIGIFFKTSAIRYLSLAASAFIAVFCYFYFKTTGDIGILYISAVLNFLFFYLGHSVYYDYKDKLGLKLYYLPKVKIFFYA